DAESFRLGGSPMATQSSEPVPFVALLMTEVETRDFDSCATRICSDQRAEGARSAAARGSRLRNRRRHGLTSVGTSLSASTPNLNFQPSTVKLKPLSRNDVQKGFWGSNCTKTREMHPKEYSSRRFRRSRATGEGCAAQLARPARLIGLRLAALKT